MFINFRFFTVVFGLMLLVGCTPQNALQPVTNETVNNYYTYVTNQYAISTNYIYVTRTVYKTKTTNCMVGITVTNNYYASGLAYIIWDGDYCRENITLNRVEVLDNGIWSEWLFRPSIRTNVIFFYYQDTPQTNRYTLSWPEDVIITNYKLSAK